jgi:hypothetical protein
LKVTLQTVRGKKSTGVDMRLSRGSIVRRPGNKDPHQRQQSYIFGGSFNISSWMEYVKEWKL